MGDDVQKAVEQGAKALHTMSVRKLFDDLANGVRPDTEIELLRRQNIALLRLVEVGSHLHPKRSEEVFQKYRELCREALDKCCPVLGVSSGEELHYVTPAKSKFDESAKLAKAYVALNSHAGGGLYTELCNDFIEMYETLQRLCKING